MNNRTPDSNASGTLARNTNNHKWNLVGAIVIAFSGYLVNPYFAKYALRLGGGDMEMAFLNSLPALLSMVSLIPGAMIIDMIGKQVATAFFMFLHKVFFLLMAAVPLLPETFPRGLIFVILVALMNLPGGIYTNGFNSSLGDLFDPRERNLAIGRRNKFTEVTRIGVTLLSGLIMTIPKTDESIIHMYQIFFVVAFFISLLEVYAFKRFEFPPMKKNTVSREEFRSSLRLSLKFTFTDRRFLLFMVLSMFFYIGWHYGWPLFNVYTVKFLGANEIYIAYYSVAAAIASVVGASFWVWVGKSTPASKTILYAAIGMSVTPFLYIVCNTLETQVICYIFSGFFIVGTTMNMLLLILENTPTENRTTIMSIHATLVAISQTIVPVLSVKVLDHLSIEESLALTGVLRFLGVFMLFLFYLAAKKDAKRIGS